MVNVGDIVTIYEDPVVKENVEGLAKAVEVLDAKHYPGPLCKVRFMGDTDVVTRVVVEGM